MSQRLQPRGVALISLASIGATISNVLWLRMRGYRLVDVVREIALQSIGALGIGFLISEVVKRWLSR